MKFAQLSVNQHYFGDNLQVLREHLVPESVYLIYLDPLYKFITIRILVPQHQLVTRIGSLILGGEIGKQFSQRDLLKRIDAHNL